MHDPMPDTQTQPYDPDAMFHRNGPFEPHFIHDAVMTLMRNLPLEDPEEPQPWAHRRMFSAMRALSALHPRSEIELMLGVQALSAYHAAASCWRIGMNSRRPNGDGTRHIVTAATAARTFDTLLKALERRQAKPLSVPIGRPASRVWDNIDPTEIMREWEDRCGEGEIGWNGDGTSAEPRALAPADAAFAEELKERKRIDTENEGLDIANTGGILPGGGMIMPENPTPNQIAYMERRLKLMYRREIAENRRKGIKAKIRIRPLRIGDLIP